MPVGAKKYYEASDAWNKFEIVEDETVEAFVKVYTEGRERVLTLNEFSLKNLVYNINQIKFALDSRADRRDRSFSKPNGLFYKPSINHQIFHKMEDRKLTERESLEVITS